MKYQFFELLFIASLFAYAGATSCTDEDWLKYKEEFNKTYKSTEDELSHFNTFCDNIKVIDQHNELYKNGESTYEMGVNQFTDMTREELSHFFGGGNSSV